MMKTICIPELGDDKIWRVTMDIYYCPRPIHPIAKILEKATGIKWFFMGAFMDVACFGTKKKPPKEFTVKIPWEE